MASYLLSGTGNLNFLSPLIDRYKDKKFLRNKIVKFLVLWGVDINCFVCEYKNALVRALQNNSIYNDKADREHDFNLIRFLLLLKMKGHVQIRDEKELEDELYVALKFQRIDIEIMELFLDAGIGVDFSSTKYGTPLNFCIQELVNQLDLFLL